MIFRIVGENDGSESLVFLLSDTEAACCQFAAECVVSMSCEGLKFFNHRDRTPNSYYH